VKTLATNIATTFDKASEAFKAFDTRKLGHLVFSDFMSGVIDYKLAGANFTKEVLLQIFTFLDTDKDNRLKYADFCSLFSQGQQETDEPFMKVLDSIKNRKVPRAKSAVVARIDNKLKKPINAFEQVKTLEDINSNEGLSHELTRYIARNRNFQSGHSVFTPAENKLDTNDARNQIKMVDISSRATSANVSARTQRTYGATSHTMAVKMDPMAKHGGGTIYGCLTNLYERNFLLEAALNDLRYKERHPAKIKFSAGSRTTKANEARMRATNRFLSILKAKDQPVKTKALG